MSRYLEVTFRRGRPFAAYLYLPRPSGAKATRTRVENHGCRVDLDPSGIVLGIEITAPSLVSLADLNALLLRLDQPALHAEEWAPAQAA